MQVNSLSNYKIILYYSLIEPGKSNVETVRLANRELTLAKSNSLAKDEEGDLKSVIDPMTSKKDTVIQKMEADFLNLKGVSKQLEDRNHPSLLNHALLQQHFGYGRYIDIYA